jgi:hypothetical protein
MEGTNWGRKKFQDLVFLPVLGNFEKPERLVFSRPNKISLHGCTENVRDTSFQVFQAQNKLACFFKYLKYVFSNVRPSFLRDDWD